MPDAEFENNLIYKTSIDLIIIKRNLRYFFYKLKKIVIIILFSFFVFLFLKNTSNILNLGETFQSKIKKKINLNSPDLKLIINGNKRIKSEFLLNLFKEMQKEKFSSIEIENKIKELRFIKDVSLSRSFFDNIIFLNILEFEPIALVFSDKNDFLKLIKEDYVSIYVNENLDNFNQIMKIDDLILIKNNENIKYNFEYILNIVKKYKIENKINFIELTNTQRFNFFMKNGLKLMLPRNKIEEAVLKYIKLENSNNYKIIDLRIEGFIFES